MPFAVCDLGGTYTKVALVNTNGEFKLEATRPTSVKSAKDLVDNACSLIDELLAAAGLKAKDVDGIGFGVAGLVDFRTGVVVSAPNLPLRNTPVKRLIEDRFRRPVAVDNDAAAAILGEARFGAGKGLKDLVMVTIGTGIGGGIIIDGELYRGATGSAGEIGHMVIDMNGPACRCGNQGCFEALASGRAIAIRARSAVRATGGKSLIMKLAKGDLKAVTGELVAQAAAEDDRAAIAVLKETGRIVGVGLANVVNIFNPEMIVLGGGVMEGDKVILREALTEVKRCALQANREAVKIVKSSLGAKAGLLGAAVLAMEASKQAGGRKGKPRGG